MAEMKLKELWKEIEEAAGESVPFLFGEDWPYPEEDPDFNFITDYVTSYQIYDRYFLKEHGEKLIDLDEDYTETLTDEWRLLIASIYNVYAPSWAHIYNTLNIAYNPVYNVEEHIVSKYGEHETEVEYGAHETEMQYGQHETDMQYGQHETDMQYGATSDTLGTHTDTSTNYSVSFDDTTEKETGKTENVVGAQTNTSLVHTDTETSKLHTDTTTSKLHTDTETSKLHTDTTTSKLHQDEVDRTGNIGIKSATALATEEIFMREKQIFFKNIFLTISREIGAYYELNY